VGARQAIEWTKLRAIARVLNKENADHWIGIAAKHSKKEINELVKKHLVASGKAVAAVPPEQLSRVNVHTMLRRLEPRRSC